MPVNTQFPFYDYMYELLEPHLPMIVNDLAGQIVEETYDGEPYTDETFTHIIDPNGAEEGDEEDDMDEEVFEQDEEMDEADDMEEDGFVGLSFGRGDFPDTERDENADISDCDYEFVIKPFFTIRPYILLGLHNYKTKEFMGEIYDTPEFQAVALLEKFADMVSKTFPSESKENQIYLLTDMAQIAMEELLLFDEPPTILKTNGDTVEKLSPYYALDNIRLYEYLIRQKRS